jgi:gliding motility-associated-like protein
LTIFKKNIKSLSLIKTYLLVCMVFNTSQIFSQNDETAHWNFGEFSGLNFTSIQSPQLLTNSQIIAPAGCSSISDVNGNLLFYTNSETIWNNNHNIMANGLSLLGSPNLAQNSIIVPIYGINNLYYTFTIGEDGLYYSKIDMSLNNGLGEVTELNTALLSEAGFGKISAVHHLNGESIWVLTTKKNTGDDLTSFYAYKVNTDGTIENPIITSDLLFAGSIEGILKISPDGTKIATTNYLPESVVNHLFLFSFNNQTGAVANKFSVFTSFAFFEVVSAYGLAFSSDSQKLYATLINQGLFDPSTGAVNLPEGSEKNTLLYQYDLTNNDPSNNAILLHEEAGEFFPASLQSARDGKIYRALSQSIDNGSNFLGVVNNPNGIGEASSYGHESFNLNASQSRLGLPNFIQSYFRTRILNENICKDEFINYETDSYAQITAAQWDFGDGNLSNEISPNYAYTNPGVYNLSVILTVNNRQITTTKRITVYDLPNLTANQEIAQCDVDSDGISVFNLNTIKPRITNPDLDEQLIFYETIEDAEQNINSINNSNNYTNTIAYQEIYVRAINSNGCYAISSFFLNAIFVDLLTLPDFFVCEDSDGTIGDDIGTFSLLEISTEIRSLLGFPNSTNIDFYPSLEDAQTVQNVIRSNHISTSTTLWIRGEESDLSCSGIAPVNLFVNNLPLISLNENYTFCNGIGISLQGNSSNDRFEWLDSSGEIISTLQQFTTNVSGNYTHIAYKTQNGIECSSTKTFNLERIEAPVFKTIDVDLNYDNNTISICVEGNGDYEFSINNTDFYGNSTAYVFNHIESGIQTVYVRDIDQCETPISTTLYLIGYPKFFTPNNDGVNDFWRIKGLEENTYESIRIFNRYGKQIADLNQYNGLRWDGRINNVIMPSNDYWFKVEFKDGNVTTGHFSLKN